MNVIEKLIVDSASLFENTQRLVKAGEAGVPMELPVLLELLASTQSLLAHQCVMLAVQLDRVQKGLPILDADIGLAVVEGGNLA